MSPDPAPSPTPNPAPAPAPAPAESWIARQAHTIEQAVHNTVVYLDPLRVEIEQELATVAHKTWQNAAAWTADYFARNAPELGEKAAEAIVALIVKEIPGAAPFASQISTAVVTEAAKMFEVLVAELRKEGQIIAPPPAPAPPQPAPTPAPAPEPSK